MILFRTVKVGPASKGYVEFAGLAVIERSELVIQWDIRSRRSYPNYVYDLVVLSLVRERERLSWRWVNARRDASMRLEETQALAPAAWREWVDRGPEALGRVRRNVAHSNLQSAQQQRPDPGSAEEKVLRQVYGQFNGRKHAFEAVAAAVTERVLSHSGSTYRRGWLTRPSGDRGIDFVGRVDLGSGSAATRLVVLGQAKCVLPTSSVSAEDVARVVARLRRGWIGAYVTTGVFSKPAQEEILSDSYPLVMINGRRLAEEIRAMAFETHGGDVGALLDSLTSGDTAIITHRQPDEVLHL